MFVTNTVPYDPDGVIQIYTVRAAKQLSEGVTNHSFLLRLWQVPTNDEHDWRILLENIQTGEKCGFANLEEFLAYLSQVTAEANLISGEGSHIEVQG